MEGGLRNAPVGPEGGRPDIGPNTLPVKGQVHDELTRRGPVEGAGGTVDRDRAEYRPLDGVIVHAGERSQAHFVGAEVFCLRS